MEDMSCFKILLIFVVLVVLSVILLHLTGNINIQDKVVEGLEDEKEVLKYKNKNIDDNSNWDIYNQ